MLKVALTENFSKKLAIKNASEIFELAQRVNWILQVITNNGAPTMYYKI